ncbi:hypothetical protein APHAL10511_000249 [Amanita phalloides]|nr:hypothetical protein APHAL10511_000249 [Amanita phalloides]
MPRPSSCTGCGREFKTPQGYSAHFYRCPKYQDIWEQTLSVLETVDAVAELGVPPQTNGVTINEEGMDEQSDSAASATDALNQPLTIIIPHPTTVEPSNQQATNTELKISHSSGRARHSEHACQMPARYCDILPPVAMPDQSEEDDNQSQESFYDTDTNSFGVFCSYNFQPPTFTSDTALESLCDSPHFYVSKRTRKWWAGISRSALSPSDSNPTDGIQAMDRIADLSKQSYYHPFPNASSYLLVDWHHKGSNLKTLADLDGLIKNDILNPDFKSEELANFSATWEVQRLDNIRDKALAESLFQADDGWYKTTVNIPVPFEHVKNESMSAVPIFGMESLYYRRPLEVIKAAFEDATPTEFHLQPFKRYWQCDNNDTELLERLYSELYDSDEFLSQHDHLQRMHRTSEHEVVIAAIMLWSDSTQLANFGTASLWPIYLFLGNQSKYVRCKPGAFAAHHIAYIPKLSNKIQEFCVAQFQKPAMSHVLSHLHQELMHEIWTIILDDEFLKSYTEGILVEFNDSVVHRVFPRVLTYSADYPEK